jgi:hypothetical protein
MKNSGKEEITNRVVEASRSTKGISTEIIPINLTWKVNTLTSTKESQVKKSSGTDTTNIKNKKVNQNQQPECQRRTPAHRQQHFLWT